MALVNGIYAIDTVSPDIEVVQWNNTAAALTALTDAGVRWRQLHQAVGGFNTVDVFTTNSGWQRVEHLGCICIADSDPIEIYVESETNILRYHEIVP